MSAPIIRSAALQKALALAPARREPAAGTFASALSQAQAHRPHTKPTPRHNAPAPSSGTLPPNLSVAVRTEPGDLPFRDLITAAATRHGVEPALLAALVKQESSFNPNARSRVGAKGLTQLMDATARGLGVTDAFDPAQSLEGGARFLGGLLKQFNGDERLALAAYNAGPGAVQKYGGIPPYEETQRYVPKVLTFAAQFRRIMADSNGTPNA